MSREVLLTLVDVRDNNNKFYRLVEALDGMSVTCYWGRIGVTENSNVVQGAGAYDRILRGKLRKGYTELRDPVMTGRKGGDAPLARDRVASSLFTGDANTDLLRLLISQNRHTIADATGGRISVNADSGAVTTALGPVSSATVALARVQFDSLASGAFDHTNVERYLRLIPQAVRNLRVTDWITPKWLDGQRDLLDALDTAVTMNTASATDDAPLIPFRHRLTELGGDSAEFRRISAVFANSANPHHRSSRHSLSAAWELSDSEEKGFLDSRKRLKTVRELWHGTSAGNILSILRTGLIAPPTDHSNRAKFNQVGRMFGDGVYFSDQSTKSLNYGTGSAPGLHGRGGVDSPMMFLADVVTGRECASKPGDTPTSLTRRARSGEYDSIIVNGGDVVTSYQSRILNNEMIVWETRQIRPKYLCQFR